MESSSSILDKYGAIEAIKQAHMTTRKMVVPLMFNLKDDTNVPPIVEKQATPKINAGHSVNSVIDKERRSE
tara:strand:- start:206 stop:418 length:213 start_codon:yes stop_codon:yes gene_type:complete